MTSLTKTLSTATAAPPQRPRPDALRAVGVAAAAAAAAAVTEVHQVRRWSTIRAIIPVGTKCSNRLCFNLQSRTCLHLGYDFAVVFSTSPHHVRPPPVSPSRLCFAMTRFVFCYAIVCCTADIRRPQPKEERRRRSEQVPWRAWWQGFYRWWRRFSSLTPGIRRAPKYPATKRCG